MSLLLRVWEDNRWLSQIWIILPTLLGKSLVSRSSKGWSVKVVVTSPIRR